MFLLLTITVIADCRLPIHVADAIGAARSNWQSAIGNHHLSGVGLGVTGRLFSLLTGREFEFRTSPRFTLLRGVVFTLSPLAFALGRFALTSLFVLPLTFLLPLTFSFAFLFLGGRLGLLSLLFALAFVLRFSLGSSGVTLSGVSPSLVTRLMSMATV